MRKQPTESEVKQLVLQSNDGQGFTLSEALNKPNCNANNRLSSFCSTFLHFVPEKLLNLLFLYLSNHSTQINRIATNLIQEGYQIQNQNSHMSTEMKTNPLIGLIGTWEGDKGTDLAPKPEEDENNPYYETLIIEAVDMEISNAEEQELTAVRYRQTVHEKETDEMSHSEAGFWIWDNESDTIMCSFAIPRGVSIVAEGSYKKSAEGEITFQVSTNPENPGAGIAEASFMARKAKTPAFKREFKLSGNTISYEQETTVDIYGKVFAHKDNNTLMRVK